MSDDKRVDAVRESFGTKIVVAISDVLFSGDEESAKRVFVAARRLLASERLSEEEIWLLLYEECEYKKTMESSVGIPESCGVCHMNMDCHGKVTGANWMQGRVFCSASEAEAKVYGTVTKNGNVYCSKCGAFMGMTCDPFRENTCDCEYGAKEK